MPLAVASVQFSTAEIARLTQGTLEGDPAVVITHLSSLEDGDTGALSFLADPRYAPRAYDSACSAILVKPDFQPERPLRQALIRVPNPQLAFNHILTTYFIDERRRAGIEPMSYVAPDATVAADAYVAPLAYIGAGAEIGPGAQIHAGAVVSERCVVGENSVIHPNVTLYPDTRIGARVVIHGGTTIGSDGFGYIQHEGKSVKVPQIGHVIIEDDVEIGANCTVDRGTIGPTIIRAGAKIDNLVHLAHNVEVGADAILAAQVGIAGSTKLGRRVMLGGQVGLLPHLSLADFTQVGAQSGVSKSVKNPGKVLRGSPARDINSQLKIEAGQSQLHSLIKRVEELERLLSAFVANGDASPAEALLSKRTHHEPNGSDHAKHPNGPHANGH